MLRLLSLSLMSVLMLAGCASTGMYHAPTGEQAATLTAVSYTHLTLPTTPYV